MVFGGCVLLHSDVDTSTWDERRVYTHMTSEWSFQAVFSYTPTWTQARGMKVVSTLV